MKTSDFDFNLPNSLIAQIPSKNRGDSRMLVINRKNNSIAHHYIKDLTNFLDSKDILVFNDTKVIPARLFGNKKTGGKIEILLLNENEENEWNVLIKSSRKPKINDEFMLCDGSVYAKVIGFKDNGSSTRQPLLNNDSGSGAYAESDYDAQGYSVSVIIPRITPASMLMVVIILLLKIHPANQKQLLVIEKLEVQNPFGIIGEQILQQLINFMEQTIILKFQE